jgi:hypothetical protein
VIAVEYEDLGKICPKCGAIWVNCPPEDYNDWWQCEHCGEFFECYYWLTPEETADMWTDLYHDGPEFSQLYRAEVRLHAETVVRCGMRLKFFGRYGDYDWQHQYIEYTVLLFHHPFSEE